MCLVDTARGFMLSFWKRSATEPAGHSRTATAAISLSLTLVLARALITSTIGFPFSLALVLPAALSVISYSILSKLKYRRFADLLACYALYRAGGICLLYFTFSALVVGQSFPIADAKLASADTWLGFDWMSYVAFFTHNPWFSELLRYAYQSSDWQPVAVVLLLLLRDCPRDAFILLLAIPIGIMMVSSIAVFVPAYGTVHYYGYLKGLTFVTADNMASTIDWLRSSSSIAPSKINTTIIAFPSFHTTLALLLMWACRRSRAMLVFSIPLNIAMLLATPIHGSHYLVDMLAGAVVAAFVISILEGIIISDCAIRTENRAAWELAMRRWWYHRRQMRIVVDA